MVVVALVFPLPSWRRRRRREELTPKKPAHTQNGGRENGWGNNGRGIFASLLFFLYLRSLFFFSSYEADASFICERIRKESRIPFSNSFFGIKFALLLIKKNLFIFAQKYIRSC